MFRSAIAKGAVTLMGAGVFYFFGAEGWSRESYVWLLLAAVIVYFGVYVILDYWTGKLD